MCFAKAFSHLMRCVYDIPRGIYIYDVMCMICIYIYGVMFKFVSSFCNSSVLYIGLQHHSASLLARYHVAPSCACTGVARVDRYFGNLTCRDRPSQKCISSRRFASMAALDELKELAIYRRCRACCRSIFS